MGTGQLPMELAPVRIKWIAGDLIYHGIVVVLFIILIVRFNNLEAKFR